MRLHGGIRVVGGMALLWQVASPAAATDTITFGNELGFSYGPAALEASVGDTVVWVGNFGLHPLLSFSVPDGAEPFDNASGSSYTYVLKIPGEYVYECALHGSFGMNGRIQVGAASLRVPFSRAHPGVRIEAVGDRRQPVGIRISSAVGPVGAELYRVNGVRVAEASRQGVRSGRGAAEVYLDLRGLAAGSYIVRARAGEGEWVFLRWER